LIDPVCWTGREIGASLLNRRAPVMSGHAPSSIAATGPERESIEDAGSDQSRASGQWQPDRQLSPGAQNDETDMEKEQMPFRSSSI
jgi:hypothetical protein